MKKRKFNSRKVGAGILLALAFLAMVFSGFMIISSVAKKVNKASASELLGDNLFVFEDSFSPPDFPDLYYDSPTDSFSLHFVSESVSSSFFIGTALNLDSGSPYFLAVSEIENVEGYPYFSINLDDDLRLPVDSSGDTFVLNFIASDTMLDIHIFFSEYSSISADYLKIGLYAGRYGTSGDYDSGYEDGYQDGKNDGYEDGKNDGYEDGKNDGYENGKNDGYEDGKNDGYEDGLAQSVIPDFKQDYVTKRNLLSLPNSDNFKYHSADYFVTDIDTSSASGLTVFEVGKFAFTANTKYCLIVSGVDSVSSGVAFNFINDFSLVPNQKFYVFNFTSASVPNDGCLLTLYSNPNSYLSGNIHIGLYAGNYTNETLLKQVVDLRDEKCLLYGGSYNDGYTQGNTDGYENGKTDGYDDGYENGKTDGYENGKTDGYNDGYTQGDSDGFDNGHSIGYNEGYNKGKHDVETSVDTGKDLFFGILDAPINAIKNIFNFEIFGINVASAIFFIVSGVLIVFLVKKLF